MQPQWEKKLKNLILNLQENMYKQIEDISIWLKKKLHTKYSKIFI